MNKDETLSSFWQVMVNRGSCISLEFCYYETGRSGDAGLKVIQSFCTKAVAEIHYQKQSDEFFAEATIDWGAPLYASVRAVMIAVSKENAECFREKYKPTLVM